MRQSFQIVFVASVLVACGTARPHVTDSGTPGTDSGTPGTDSGTPGTDSGMPGHDAGMPARDSGTTDPCAADMPPSISGVGCNGGFISGAQPANSAFGTCTPDADPTMHPAGSCTDTTQLCVIAMMGATTGGCTPTCDPGMLYTSTSTCPHGSRCFPTMAGGGACFRDCDATHGCPLGGSCDTDGSCPLAP